MVVARNLPVTRSLSQMKARYENHYRNHFDNDNDYDKDDYPG